MKLQAVNGKLVCSEFGGGPGSVLNARTDPPGNGWEEFVEVDAGNGLVALKTDGGYYVSAQPDGTVQADRQVIGPWECWTKFVQPHGIGYLSVHERFLCCDLGLPVSSPDWTGHRVVANRPTLGTWETFIVSGKAPLVLPSRAEVLASLRADIAPSTQEGADILGTWQWLGFDDETFTRVAEAYHAAGHRLVPCSMVISNYQGISFDLTIDVPLLQARLERTYQAGLIPMVALNCVDRDGAGPETLARLPALLDALRGHLCAVFTGWEIRVDGGPSVYSYEEHLAVIRLARERLPDVVIGVELWTPSHREEPIIYDGRGGLDAVAYWRHTDARLVDALLLELPYGIVEDRRAVAAVVGGTVYRLQGAFPHPTHWPEGDLIDSATLDHWRVDYGTHKAVVLFEYAAYLRWASTRKRALREYVQAVVPISGYGEG